MSITKGWNNNKTVKWIREYSQINHEGYRRLILGSLMVTDWHGPLSSYWSFPCLLVQTFSLSKLAQHIYCLEAPLSLYTTDTKQSQPVWASLGMRLLSDLLQHYSLWTTHLTNTWFTVNQQIYPPHLFTDGWLTWDVFTIHTSLPPIMYTTTISRENRILSNNNNSPRRDRRGGGAWPARTHFSLGCFSLNENAGNWIVGQRHHLLKPLHLTTTYYSKLTLSL